MCNRLRAKLYPDDEPSDTEESKSHRSSGNSKNRQRKLLKGSRSKGKEKAEEEENEVSDPAGETDDE